MVAVRALAFLEYLQCFGVGLPASMGPEAPVGSIAEND